jgi:histidyl-tRNA synthetase
VTNKIQSIRGMEDVLPDASPLVEMLEDACRRVFRQYGYRNIRTPIVEPTALFVRGIGEATDIVEKEMYVFEDRNGESLALRPEATAGIVRAAIEHNFLYNGPMRVWTNGPMFRYERPQKGRYRQFDQFDVEALGFEGPDVDAEQIVMLARLWKALGIRDAELHINSIGDAADRKAHREKLVAYFEQHGNLLDEDAKRRLHTNPLRILDSKNPAIQEMIEGAPRLLDRVGDGAAAHFEELKWLLDEAGLAYVVNPRLVRGLDYYTRTVFEWVTDRLGAQSAVCSGGRYDGLVEQLGGRSTPAVGWALGIERAVELLRLQPSAPASRTPDAILVTVGDAARQAGFGLAERLRDAAPCAEISIGAPAAGFKAQMRRADKSGATYALIVGDDELAAGTVTVKPLRRDEPQRGMTVDELARRLSAETKGPE